MSSKSDIDQDPTPELDASLSRLSLKFDTRSQKAYDVWVCAFLASRRRRSLDNMALAIFMARSLCVILSQTDPRLSETLRNLASLLLERFSMLKMPVDVEAALHASQCAMDIAERTGQSPDTKLLADLHMSLLMSLNVDGPTPIRLDQAIIIGKHLVESLDIGCPDAAMHHSNLAASYRLRYQYSRNKSDLVSAISSARYAVNVSTDRSVIQFQAYHNLGLLRLDMFELTHATADLEEALRVRWSAFIGLETTHPAIQVYPIENASIIDANASHLRNFHDLDLIIDILQTALVLMSNDAPRIEEHACDLATALFSRYERTRTSADLDLAIEVIRLSISFHAPNNVQLPTRQFMLCLLLEERYDMHHSREDLDAAITACVEATTRSDSEAPIDQLEKMDHLLTQRYQSDDRIEDLEHLIVILTRLVATIPEGDVKKAQCIMRSGLLFADLYPRVGRIELLNLSTGALQEAAKRFVPGTHNSQRIGCLNSLAGSYRTQYYATGQLSLLELAINTQRQVVSLINADPPDLAVGYASNLSLLSMLAGELGNDTDTVALLEGQASKVEKVPDSHEEKSTLLLNLALAYSRLYSISGDLSHLDAAISETRRCLDMMPLKHRDRYLVLMNAGSFHRRRFERQGDIADLDAAMTLLRDSTSRLHPRHPERAEHFVSLAQAHLTRFQHLGQVMDLDESINLARRALDISAQHVFKGALLQTLGTALLKRFERLHDQDDLNASVSANRDALSLLSDSHEEKSTVLSSMAAALGMRYEKLRILSDLDEGVGAIQAAVDLSLDEHPMKPLYLSYLGKFMGGLRFNSTGDVAHLEAGVIAEEAALRLIDHDHAGRPLHLGDLSRYLEVRFSHTQNRSDIDRAIHLLQEALSSTSGDNSNRLEWCFRLGSSFCARFETYGDYSDLELALEVLMSTFMSGVQGTNPMIQFEAAHLCGVLHQRHCTAIDPMPIFSRMIDLVPHVVWLGGKLSQRYTDVKRISNMIDDAVAAAIASRDVDATIDWLEQSRCIVWSQLQSLRFPLDSVRAVNPILATDIEQVAHSLQMLATRNNSGFGKAGKEITYRDVPVEDEGLVHRAITARYDQLLSDARALPGLENFMRPERVSKSGVWAAMTGPIVLIHPVNHRCEVICILPLKTGQTMPNRHFHLRLGTFTAKLAHTLRQRLLECLRDAGVTSRAVVPRTSTGRDGFEPVLQILWARLVKPIIDEIQKHYTLKDRAELPHITWCPSGPAAFLPLHAAGLYDGSDKEQPRAYELFVSSYTPSLTALLDAYRRHDRRAIVETRTALAIAQPHTPGLSPLPATTREVDIIQGIIPTLQRLDGTAATRSAVLEAMKEYHWVHLACHGIQNGDDPTQSALRLHDGALELREMMRASFPKAELAVLSACETATGDDTLPQEAVHLAAGMMMAGFESVVATSWSISDEDGPLLARELYAHLLGESQGDVRRTAYALHHAMKRLRERVGEKNFVRWLPFVHVGI